MVTTEVTLAIGIQWVGAGVPLTLWCTRQACPAESALAPGVSSAVGWMPWGGVGGALPRLSDGVMLRLLWSWGLWYLPWLLRAESTGPLLFCL